MSDTPLHDWMHPRLRALIAAAVEAGFARDAAVAVALDIMEGAEFAGAAAPPVGGASGQ